MKRKRQGYMDRYDESLGMRDRGHHMQSMKDRRDESKGMKRMHDKDYHHHMAHAHHQYMADRYRKKI